MLVEELAGAIYVEGIGVRGGVFVERGAGQHRAERVDRNRAHVDDTPEITETSRLEDVGGPDAVHVDRRSGVPEPSRPQVVGQVNNALDVVVSDDVDERRRLHHVASDDRDLVLQLGKGHAIRRDVERDHLLPGSHQMPDQVTTKEARPSSH